MCHDVSTSGGFASLCMEILTRPVVSDSLSCYVDSYVERSRQDKAACGQSYCTYSQTGGPLFDSPCRHLRSDTRSHTIVRRVYVWCGVCVCVCDVWFLLGQVCCHANRGYLGYSATLHVYHGVIVDSPGEMMWTHWECTTT